LSGELQIDHTIPLIRLKKLNLLKGANYYKNINFVEPKLNAAYKDTLKGKIDTDAAFEIMKGVVELSLKNNNNKGVVSDEK
jgi:hypothetical protein